MERAETDGGSKRSTAVVGPTIKVEAPATVDEIIALEKELHQIWVDSEACFILYKEAHLLLEEEARFREIAIQDSMDYLAYCKRIKRGEEEPPDTEYYVDRKFRAEPYV